MKDLTIPAGMRLPKTLEDVDAAFMTALLRARGVIDKDNQVVATEESGVGMTAGYFSAIKKVRCRYAKPTDAADAFVVKTWPTFENAPREQIAGMFAKDIAAYSMPAAGFYPRPKVYLADFDVDTDRWALLMADASAFGQQKLHEQEMSVDEVMHMIPKLVEIAVAWEGCNQGDKAARLDAMRVSHWASEQNLAQFRQILPAGAPLFDVVTSMPDSTLIQGRPWDRELGSSFCTLITRKLDALFSAVRPEQGATCTMVHGDLRGDNLFFCPTTADYPSGWLTIDFQLLFRGPVPSDLAYLMNSGSVLPEVYAAENRDRIMRAFYERFMDHTTLYKGYTWEQFCREYTVMATVLMVYYVGFGANIFLAGLNDALPARVELGARGDVDADLAPEELRQRMWWRKSFANFRTTFQDFRLYQHLESLPDNRSAMAPWTTLPARLQR